MSDSFFRNDPGEKPTNDIPELDAPLESRDNFEEELSEENRMAAIMSYIPLLCFIPLLNMPENKTARFHARQGVLLFVAELAALIMLVDGISHFIFKTILIVALGLSVVGLYFALKGKNYKLPFVGDIADKSKF